MPSAVVGSYAALRMRPALYGYTSACVSDGHIFSLAWEKIWKKRTLFCSETAVTYLLKKQMDFYATPIAYQKNQTANLVCGLERKKRA